MTDFSSLAAFAARLSLIAMEIEPATQSALEKSAQMIETEAKRVIGTYEYGWPQLAPATRADRVAKGFPENEPLLRTGEMRDSIEHTVGKNEAHIGSNNEKAVWQELGTSRGTPPRSYLGDAAMRKAPEVVSLIGHDAAGVIAGRKVI